MKNNVVNIIKTMMREIEAMDDKLFVYAHCEKNWVEVSVSDFEFYMHDEGFKTCCKKWHKVFDKMKLKVVYVCGWVSTEKKLLALANENNLIIT